ncbi:ATP-binding protein [Geomonas sp.]|uniref:ATP-binding protein n=1 Tax=Geomonas sp. TaxID=2651584 RepID=UPI002B46BD01|nr:ATP-binding protein [Geomonas sp.]HJV35746.1 ATP-binding protein [Geomonas sp.]
MESRLADKPLYNSRIINSFILLIKHKYSYINVSELLSHAGMKEYEVADQAHWFKQEQVDRFYEKLVQLTGNPKIALEAGRYAASPDVLGAMRQYILGLVDASSAFEIINKATANFTRSSSYESRPLSSNMVEIVVTPLEEGLEKQYQCENRIGFFQAIVLIFNHKLTDLQYVPELQHLPSIQHPECVFRGDRVCRYLISWDKSLYVFLRKLRNVVGVFVAVFNLTLALTGRWGLIASLLPATITVFLALALGAEKGEKRALKASLNNTKESMDNLLDQIDLNYNNAMLTNEIGQTLGSFTSVEEMLPEVALVMQHRLDYDRGVILLAANDRSRLEVRASYGYSSEQLLCLNAFPFRLEEADGSRDVYVDSFLSRRPFLVNDLEEAKETLGQKSLACASTTGTQAFICCPIVVEESPLGVLAVENVKAKKPLVERDISLLMGIASMVGISILNCELIGALERANEELELRVAKRTLDLELSRKKLQMQHQELERTYFELEEETSQRLKALEELSEKERLLLQQSRLAALGEMISNIAHQWRQPLNELGLIVQELPMIYDKGEFSRDYLKGSVAKFMKLLAHTSKTIDDFRNFFKPDKERVAFQVKEVVEQTLSLVEDSFKQLGIKVDVRVEGEPVIMGHPNEFSQVILNLLFNARDAFLDRQVAERRIAIEIGKDGGTAVVTVADNAGGIDPAVIDKIFDPYFTTRGPEKGTGIGLYMSKIIIEKNIPGRLSVRNTAEGAEFRIVVEASG